jgi:hypothetical protein
MIPADEDGHLQGSQDVWILWQQPRVTTAAATDLFDLFNASGSGKTIRIRSIFPYRTIAAASAVLTPWEFAAIRTSAVGTGGTAVNFATPLTAPPAAGVLAASPADSSNVALPAQITARSLPTGGATAAVYWFSIFLHILNSATVKAPEFEALQTENQLPELPYAEPFVLREGQGMKLRQITATASTGVAFGWLLLFTVT